MRTAIALSMAVLAAFSMTGCTQEPIIPYIPISMYSCAVEPFNDKDLQELHLDVERVELHRDGIAGQEFTYGKDVDVDLDLAGATDGWSVFAGEWDVPGGDYKGFTLLFGDAYGVRANGDTVPVDLKHDKIRIDRGFSTESDVETRVVMCIDGELAKKGLEYGYDNGFDDIRFTPVADATSGSDVHEIGELVRLPEAFN